MPKDSNISRRDFIKQAGVGAGIVLGSQLIAPPFLRASGDKADLMRYKGTKLKVLGHPTHHVEGVIEFHTKFTELTGIEVEVQLFEEPVQREKQVLDYASGRGEYDAAFVPFMFMVEYMKAGYLEPLDAYIKEQPVNFGDKAFDLNDYPLWVTVPFRRDFDASKELYSIGQCAYIPQITYRTDYMKELGIEIPKTVEEYDNNYLAAYDKAMAGKLEMHGQSFYPSAVRASPSFESYYSFAGITNAYGDPRLIDLDKMEPFPDKEAWLKGLTWISNVIRKYGHPGQATMTWHDLIPFMQAGQIGSWLDHSGYHSVWQLAKESKVKEVTGYGPPLVGPSGRAMSTCPYSDGFAINAGGKNKGAAWYFLAWTVSNHRYQLELEKDIRYDLPNIATVNSDRYQSKIKDKGLQEWYRIWTSKEFNGLKVDDPDTIKFSVRHYPAHELFLEVVEAYQSQASEVVAGSKEPEKALDDHQPQRELRE